MIKELIDIIKNQGFDYHQNIQSIEDVPDTITRKGFYLIQSSSTGSDTFPLSNKVQITAIRNSIEIVIFANKKHIDEDGWSLATGQVLKYMLLTTHTRTKKNTIDTVETLSHNTMHAKRIIFSYTEIVR